MSLFPSRIKTDHVSQVCSSCQLGKISQFPFSSTTNKSTFPFELIHIDIQGPALVLSHSGHSYYIHFLDDFSKFSWFFVMKSRADALKIFLAFHLQVENLFDRKMKALQSDGAKDFFSSDFQHE